MKTRVPMFPLGMVMCPFTAVPLRVFEPRYQALLDNVLEGDRKFGITLIERGSEVGGGEDRFAVGTLVRVSGVADLEEGHRAMVVAGIERINVVKWLDDDPHPWAEVIPAPDEQVEDVGELLGEARRQLGRVMALASELGADTAEVDLEVADDPVIGSFQIAALSPVTALDAQKLLEAADARQRLELVIGFLAERVEILKAKLAEG